MPEEILRSAHITLSGFYKRPAAKDTFFINNYIDYQQYTTLYEKD
jgi:hypothetical protein